MKWSELGVGCAFCLLMCGFIYQGHVHTQRLEKENFDLVEQNVELMRQNIDLEEQCLALNNSLEWWMGYAEGASQAREAAFRECDL